MIISKKILKNLKFQDKDFSEFLFKISKKKLLGGIICKNGYASIGDKRRLNQTRKLFSNNNILVTDRDGVLNISPKRRYLTDVRELKINKKLCSKFPKYSNFICITNQAGLSTKDLTFTNLNKINLKIQDYFRKEYLHMVFL